jgi:hypothetical protein
MCSRVTSKSGRAATTRSAVTLGSDADQLD